MNRETTRTKNITVMVYSCLLVFFVASLYYWATALRRTRICLRLFNRVPTAGVHSR